MDLLDEVTLFNHVNDLSLGSFGKPFKHQVVLNYRLRTTGGRYLPTEKRIEINPKYIVEMDMAEVNGIIKHELCHYHLHIEGKGYKHGDKAFKDLLKATNSPRYCKPLPSNLKERHYVYRCQACNHVYRRVRKVDVNKYRCGKCRGIIEKEK